MMFKRTLFLSLLSTSLMSAPVLAEPVISLNTPVLEQSFDLPEIHFSQATNAEHGTTIFGLPQNMGPIDRSLRGLLALGLAGAGIYGLSSGQISTPISATLLGVSLIPTATAATGYCPLYQIFGVDYSF